MPKRACFFWCSLLTLLCGCSNPLDVPVTESTESETVPAQLFDPATTGTIRGRVCWDGAVPTATSTEIRAIAYHNALYKNPVQYETTHVPKVDRQSGGVEDAIVFLRAIDPRRSRPWNHAEARVEFNDRQLCAYQGQQRTGAVFVRRGGKLETVNRDFDFHALRGRGAAFFTLPLIKPDLPSMQNLNHPGLVELFDAGGYYWSHAYCFVADHPYYTRTDAKGEFTLEQVPAGTFEIVVWMPSWHVARKERDPETGIFVRQVWAAPKEQKQTIQVHVGESAEVAFRWSQTLFGDAGALR